MSHSPSPRGNLDRRVMRFEHGGMVDMKPMVALLGIPFDEQSSHERGSAKAPSFIRDAWHSKGSNLYSEDLTLVDESLVHDAGDVVLAHGEDMLSAVEGRLDALLAEGYAPLCLGGDHSITYPVVRSVSRVHGKLDILHFDAHPDLYPDYEGNRFSHACPFARILEDGLAGRLVQVGIRSMTPPQREQADRYGVEVVDMRSMREGLRLEFSGPVYISFDVDGLDPAFAPGVSHRQPGGLSTRQALDVIQTFQGRLVGADIVEFNPLLDVPGITDAVCAKLLKEIAARMAKG